MESNSYKSIGTDLIHNYGNSMVIAISRNIVCLSKNFGIAKFFGWLICKVDPKIRTVV